MLRVVGKVRNMDDLTLEHSPRGNGSSNWGKRLRSGEGVPSGRHGVTPPPPVNLALAVYDEREIRIAQPRSRFGQCIQHRLQIEGRAADDLEHVAGRGLVFQRLLQVAGAVLQLIEQPR